MQHCICLKTMRAFATILLIALLSVPLFASGPYTIGSSNTVTADPTIPRPSTRPCIVQLLNNAEFDNFNPVPFNFTPPADCPGPWAKVVFTADINVTAGIQYDRTANFWLGPTNIYFGTTAEPSPNLGPSWHVESDLTDYSPIFMTAQQGAADIGNTTSCCGLTGIIYASSTLEFYPLANGQTAPVTANEVYALSAGPTGGTVSLNSTTSTLSGTFSLPTNIQNAYLDVYAQSQSSDEFWYTCVPNDVSGELFSCGNTAFRETEITIDGTPAGVAPIYPWVFTGGIDPFLWFPLPGVQTLNFTPYRVDLTPFASILSNGQQHTVSLSVYNANNYFSATASLLVYLDSDSTDITGALTKNTLTSAPNPVVIENLKVGNTITGTVRVASNRNFILSGYVNTSHGKVTTTINQGIGFANNQTFNITSTTFMQNITQTSNINSITTVATPGQPTMTYSRKLQFPITMDISQVLQSNGNTNQTTKSWQTYGSETTTKQGSVQTYSDLFTNAVSSQDTLIFNSGFQVIGNENQASSQLYSNSDTNGVDQLCILTASTNALTSFSPTCSQ